MTEKFRSRQPYYPDSSDYNTNAPSYYDDLARKNKLIELLSKRIWEYDEELAKRFDAWDKNLEEFDDEVLRLLQEWMDDGTFDHIINEEIFSWKADKSDLLALQTTLNGEINQLKTNKADKTELTALGNLKADKTDLQQTEYDLMESIQSLDNTMNDAFNNIVKHRPIHVGTNHPAPSIGNNGDLYLQLYSGNTFFYEEGTFTPYHAGGSTENLNINYSIQTGHYTKVGRLIHVMLRLNISSVSNLPDENLYVRGLPYSGLDTQMINFAGEIRNTGLASGRYVNSLFIQTAGNGYFQIRHASGIDANSSNTLRTNELTNNMTMMISFSYTATENAVPLIGLEKSVMK